MLKNTGLSTNTLAKYLEGLANGAISETTAKLTNYIDVLEKLHKTESLFTDTLETIDNFDAGRSQQEINEFYTNAAEAINKLYDAGIWHDPQLAEYAKLFIADYESWLDEFNTDTEKAVKQLYNIVNSYGNNLYGLWVQIANITDWADIGTNGEITLHLQGISDLNQIVDKIKELGYSEATAKALLSSFNNYSKTGASSTFNKLQSMSATQELLKTQYIKMVLIIQIEKNLKLQLLIQIRILLKIYRAVLKSIMDRLLIIRIKADS